MVHDLATYLTRAGVADVRQCGVAAAKGRLGVRPALLARCIAVQEEGGLRAQLQLLPAEPLPEGWRAAEAFLQAVGRQVRGLEFDGWTAPGDGAICLQVAGDAADAAQLLGLLTSLGRVILEKASALCCDAELARTYIDLRDVPRDRAGSVRDHPPGPAEGR